MQHYFECADAGGQTDVKSNSTTYEGEIGSLIKDGLELKPPIKFKKVRGKVEDFSNDKDFLASLNNDTKLLLEYCLALQSGKLSEELAKRIPGHIHKAR